MKHESDIRLLQQCIIHGKEMLSIFLKKEKKKTLFCIFWFWDKSQIFTLLGLDSKAFEVCLRSSHNVSY